jgi:hypothetical protein
MTMSNHLHKTTGNSKLRVLRNEGGALPTLGPGEWATVARLELSYEHLNDDGRADWLFGAREHPALKQLACIGLDDLATLAATGIAPRLEHVAIADATHPDPVHSIGRLARAGGLPSLRRIDFLGCAASDPDHWALHATNAMLETGATPRLRHIGCGPPLIDNPALLAFWRTRRHLLPELTFGLGATWNHVVDSTVDVTFRVVGSGAEEVTLAYRPLRRGDLRELELSLHELAIVPGLGTVSLDIPRHARVPSFIHAQVASLNLGASI